jgi:tol-pal system protein YbgF
VRDALLTSLTKKPAKTNVEGETPVRIRWEFYLAAAMIAGALGGAFFAPGPANAVNKEMIELQVSVNQLVQGQKAMQTSMDEKFATLRTLIEQSLDANNKLSTTMGSLQKTVQDTHANVGATLNTMGTQVQGLSDNLDEMKQRLGKINQQLTDLQSTLQSIDAKLAAAAAPANPATNPGGAGTTPGGPPPSADILYNNGLKDFNTGNYDLSSKEFQDYLKFYAGTDLASNAQFYLGEIAYSQGQYKQAIEQYDLVLDNYPKSYKLAPARYKKAMALLGLGQKQAAIKELREVVRRFPGTEDDQRARQQLRQLGVSATAPAPQR